MIMILVIIIKPGWGGDNSYLANSGLVLRPNMTKTLK